MLTRRFTFFCSLAPLLIFPMKIPFVSDGFILILIWAVSGTRYFLYALRLEQLMSLPSEINTIVQLANLPNLINAARAIGHQTTQNLDSILPNASVPINPFVDITITILLLTAIFYISFLYYRAMFRSF